MSDTQDDLQWRPIGEAVGAGDLPVEEVQSLCMRCHEQGMTRMLLTVIPYFREVIIVHFKCEHCGFENNDIQSAGQIQTSGSIYTVKITDRSDLNRQLVKSEHCTVTIPEYALQIPSGRGQFTTVEGIISDTVRDLSSDQVARKEQHPDIHDKIQELIDKLAPIVDDKSEKKMPVFTIKLDDPSGNSFIETEGGLTDPKWSKMEYTRDAAQNEALGLAPGEVETSHYPEEVLSFPGTCSLCGSTLDTLMKKVTIPHFKDIILMSTNCHDCGYRDTEVKSGGATAPKGRKITLKVEDSDDLSRDILKSDTAGMEIPEIGLELNPGTLGGRFTTLEGLLNQVYEELDEKVFAHGDAALPGATDDMAQFLQKLKQVMTVAIPFTVIVDDPMSNSYIQNLYAPDDDPNMTTEVYDRSHEQNEELGINDMNTETYQQPEADAAMQTEAQ
ncbi:nucleolar zinc-finger protein [Microbotryomycetes sp. JL221]|nr:nucleolar zinc-finger protein [Microbotryomycetes sp. JL221]